MRGENVKYLNGYRLYQGMAAGTAAVASQRKQLNDINVFPVADGDTGNNLVATLEYAVDAVRPQSYAAVTFKSFADAFLMGARGNSGLIVAQFIAGIAAEVGEAKVLTTQKFGTIVAKAAPYAYKAVSKPTEGTILTVMKDWADAVYRFRYCNNFVQLLQQSLDVARQSLAATPEKLTVLREAGVVDAGASGFVHFLSGMLSAFDHGSVGKVIRQKGKGEESMEREKVEHRYCCEGLLTGTELDVERVREHVNAVGDSAVVGGTAEKVRFHVHTNTPHQLFYPLMKMGDIRQPKVDDMQRQKDVLHNRASDIALVTDSIADVPLELQDKYQIHMLPAILNVGNSEFLDKLTLSPEQLYQVMETREDHPTTAQPSVYVASQLLEFLSEHYKSIIVITVASALSGTFNAFNLAAEQIGEKGVEVSVIDSKLNAGAQGLLVLKAAEDIAAGHSHQQVVETVREKIPNTKIYVSVSSLKYMVKGGRVSPMQGFLANALNMKPIASLDEEGRGISFAKAFSRSANRKKIVQLVKDIHRDAPLEKYAIVHARAQQRADDLAETLKEITGFEPQYIMEISTAVALNAGPDCVAVCLMS